MCFTELRICDGNFQYLLALNQSCSRQKDNFLQIFVPFKTHATTLYCIIFLNSSSFITFIPSEFALSNLLPASSPANT